MDNNAQLALIMQMIDAAEKNIQTARQLMREMTGGAPIKRTNAGFAQKAAGLNVGDGGKIIEGVFDGQNMIGPDNKQYPVPANYASKSKLVEGDVLKLTIADDGSFIYKQIGPVDRRKIIGVLMQDEKGDYKVIAEGKTYRVLLASLTYFKASSGDDVTIVVPKDTDSQWAAVENVLKHNALNADAELETYSDDLQDVEAEPAISQADDNY